MYEMCPFFFLFGLVRCKSAFLELWPITNYYLTFSQLDPHSTVS